MREKCDIKECEQFKGYGDIIFCHKHRAEWRLYCKKYEFGYPEVYEALKYFIDHVEVKNENYSRT